MARVKKHPGSFPAPAPVVEAPKDRVAALEEQVAKDAVEITELKGDLVRLARLCGQVWGEPLASEALAIAAKRQGKA